MEKKLFITFLFLSLVSLGCMRGLKQEPVAGKPSPPISTGEAQKQESRTEWDKILQEAKKGGVVTFYSVAGAETRELITKVFQQKYGIKVEFIQGRGTEIIQKMLREHSAGLYMADLLNAGLSSQLLVAKPAGILGNIEKYLKLPEVTDSKNWYDGRLPFIDKDKQVMGFIRGKTGTLIRNINLVKENEISDAFDFLKPEYRGKIVIFDPTFPGPASTWVGARSTYYWSEDKLKEFLQGLLRQEVVITRDHRFIVNGVAQGKFALGLFTRSEEENEFRKLGAPIALINLKEPATVGVSTGVISVPKKFANENAAIVFLNWLLGKEGQEVWTKSVGSPSARVDVSTEGVNPFEIIAPGEKAYPETEESVLKREKWMAISREILSPLMR